MTWLHLRHNLVYSRRHKKSPGLLLPKSCTVYCGQLLRVYQCGRMQIFNLFIFFTPCVVSCITYASNRAINAIVFVSCVFRDGISLDCSRRCSTSLSGFLSRRRASDTRPCACACAILAFTYSPFNFRIAVSCSHSSRGIPFAAIVDYNFTTPHTFHFHDIFFLL